MARKDSELTATLAAIQHTLATLSARVARLEAQLVDVYAHEDDESLSAAAVAGQAGRVNVDGGSPDTDRADGKTPSPAPDADGAIDPDVILAISAAVAAYLGERAHVKQIRLIGSQAWGRQGRVSVQASHRLYR
jgi:hypothetical protein